MATIAVWCHRAFLCGTAFKNLGQALASVRVSEQYHKSEHNLHAPPISGTAIIAQFKNCRYTFGIPRLETFPKRSIVVRSTFEFCLNYSGIGFTLSSPAKATIRLVSPKFGGGDAVTKIGGPGDIVRIVIPKNYVCPLCSS